MGLLLVVIYLLHLAAIIVFTPVVLSLAVAASALHDTIHSVLANIYTHCLNYSSFWVSVDLSLSFRQCIVTDQDLRSKNVLHFNLFPLLRDWTTVAEPHSCCLLCHGQHSHCQFHSWFGRSSDSTHYQCRDQSTPFAIYRRAVQAFPCYHQLVASSSL